MADPIVIPALRLEDHPLEDLLLDPINPRLPESIQGQSQEALLRFIADSFNVIELAESISRYGFFNSEPLIAIPKQEKYIVVEGNRRLVALLLLQDPAKSKGLAEEREWQDAAKSKVQNVDTVPVAIAASREDVDPIIGYRHIAGIKQWESFAKARFIAKLVDSGRTFTDVGNIVGERSYSIAAQYRNHQIVKQARDQLKLNTSPIEREFGSFTAAMNQAPLREYIGAPTPNEVRLGVMPIQPEKADETSELFSWIFGDEENNAVVTDSRQFRKLGEVVASTDAIAVLRATRDIDEAHKATGGPKVRTMRLLQDATSSLAAAEPGFLDLATDEEIINALLGVRARLTTLEDVCEAARG